MTSDSEPRPAHTRHTRNTLTDADIDRVALYALGTMAPADRAEFAEHLEQCEICRAETVSFEEVTAGLSLRAAPAEPPAALEGRLLERISEDQRLFEPMGGPGGQSYIVRADHKGFRPTKVAGVECRTLRLDQDANRATMLFRMAPGSSYPAHRHGGLEECIVLSGDLHVGDQVMNEGDYQCVEAGSLHPVQSTEHGCLLLISTSLSDEILA